ncbi:GNAT family N-acetyltransferase [soil metagenome]
MLIRPVVDVDIDACVAVNNANMPAVGETDAVRMHALLEEAAVSLVAEPDGTENGGGDACSTSPTIAGFCIVMPPGVDYASVNYRWFDDRYDDFAYLDRIAVAEPFRGRGIGGDLYAAVEGAVAPVPWLLCEVNLRPRNDGSLRFHHRVGFREVGQQETDYGVLVSMLAKDLRR